ncbi:MAG: hypothetical protein ACKVLN_07445 [Rhodobacterales bacterium]
MGAQLDLPDFVIAGAGHNSLITACYLAKAGYSCVIVDARFLAAVRPPKKSLARVMRSIPALLGTP